jgi:hypothetical protein
MQREINEALTEAAGWRGPAHTAELGDQAILSRAREQTQRHHRIHVAGGRHQPFDPAPETLGTRTAMADSVATNDCRARIGGPDVSIAEGCEDYIVLQHRVAILRLKWMIERPAMNHAVKFIHASGVRQCSSLTAQISLEIYSSTGKPALF